MSLQIIWTSGFKKDYKLAIKRGYDINALDDVFRLLADGKELPNVYRDHALSGNWKGFRECHIEPDWLLVYAIQNNTITLTLVRTGTHSDLFDK